MVLWDCNQCGFAMHGDECSFYVIRDLDTYCEIQNGEYKLVNYCAEIWICPKCHYAQSEEGEFFKRLENRNKAFKVAKVKKW